MSFKVFLVGSSATLGLLAALSVAWGYLGFNTGIWIDGCPDVVAAYTESHGALQDWWRDIFFYVLPPALSASSAYIGLMSYKLAAKRPNKSFKPNPLRGSA